jgi:phosphopantothenoylcysteine synthetase/decarboxylase
MHTWKKKKKIIFRIRKSLITYKIDMRALQGQGIGGQGMDNNDDNDSDDDEDDDENDDSDDTP